MIIIVNDSDHNDARNVIYCDDVNANEDSYYRVATRIRAYAHTLQSTMFCLLVLAAKSI